MPSPFPGFDPFIENQLAWPDFHADFLTEIKRSLRDVLPPGFIARTEAVISIVLPESRPSGGAHTSGRAADVGVFAVAPNSPRGGGVAVLEREPMTAARTNGNGATQHLQAPEIVSPSRGVGHFLRIVDLRSGETVVAVIELLSPSNKDGGAGNAAYRRKQEQILNSPIHFIEIDLLRGGNYAVWIPADEIEAFGAWDYLVTLRDRDAPEEGQFWRVGVRDPLPAFAVPLVAGVAPVPLDLQATFARCYDASRLAENLDYNAAPKPPLSPDDSAWADGVLRSAGLRGDGSPG